MSHNNLGTTKKIHIIYNDFVTEMFFANKILDEKLMHIRLEAKNIQVRKRTFIKS